MYTLTPAAVARNYLAVADAAGIDRFAYAGYSWGCVTGLQLALRSDRLLALVCGGCLAMDGPYDVMLAVTRAMSRGEVPGERRRPWGSGPKGASFGRTTRVWLPSTNGTRLAG